ncbi:hypothetical protein L7F22_010030 [Adiantum nelumboides]|nr:hypothetical protein [Adiantum nelumboides]
MGAVGAHNVFVYGSLLADEVVSVLLRRVPASSAALLPDFHRFNIKGRVYPAILPTKGEKVIGRGGLGIIDPEMQSCALLTKLIVKGLFPRNEPWKMLLQSGLATVTPTYGVRDGHIWTTGIRFMFTSEAGWGFSFYAILVADMEFHEKGVDQTLSSVQGRD